MTYPNYENQQSIVFEFGDDAILAHAILPVFSKFRTFERCPDRSWIVQLGNPFVQKLENAIGVLSIQFIEVASSFWQKLQCST